MRVATQPGDMQLTFTAGPASLAIIRVKALSAAFARVLGPSGREKQVKFRF
jgi:hypothetical protein